MRVEDEISIIEERIRKEIESQKNGVKHAGYPMSILQRGRVDVFSACIIEPTGELKRYIHEMLPYMHFTQPKVIVRVLPITLDDANSITFNVFQLLKLLSPACIFHAEYPQHEILLQGYSA